MSSKTGTLYLISTPIGNLEDITLRAMRYLKEITVFFAEDTREMKNLLSALHLPIEKRIFSFANHNMKEATENCLLLLQQGHDVGFCSDRGTPGICDPGAFLVAAARNQGIKVTVLPGVSSLSTAISLSGVEKYPVHFWGFIDAKERKKVFQKSKSIEGMHYFFESPKRVKDFIGDFQSEFSGGELYIAKELTKVFEFASWVSNISELSEEMLSKGEFVLGYFVPEVKQAESEDVLSEEIKLRLLPEKQWAKEISNKTGAPANLIYNRLQELKRKEQPT